jgi:DNA modification methylase
MTYKLTTLKSSEVKVNPDNPRIIKDDKFTKLVQSIKDLPKMAEIREVVVNHEYVIQGGNMRYKAMVAAGWKKIPVKILDASWTPEEIRQFVIKDNVSGGEWDWDILANQYDPIELDAWGLDLPDKSILEPEIEEDEVPELSSEPTVSQLGSIYQLGKHIVMCGDSTDIEQFEQLVCSNRASLVFTDPPYGVSYQSNMRTKSKKFDVIENDDVIPIDGIVTASEYSDGWIMVCTSWKVLKQWLDALKLFGNPKNIIIWDKGGGGIGDLKHSLATDYEVIIAYNRDAEIKGKRIGSVWDCGKDAAGKYEHPTQKPVALPALAIETMTVHNDFVFDVYLGSGSTLIACEQTGRTCYGMELDPKYVDVIRKRYAKHCYPDTWEERWEELTPEINESTTNVRI